MQKVAAILLACATVVLASACATTGGRSPAYTDQLRHLSKLRTGMARAEVLKAMNDLPVKTEKLTTSDGQQQLVWQYCSTEGVPDKNVYVWLIFTDDVLSSIDSTEDRARYNGRVVDCANVIKPGYIEERAAREAAADAERKEERARRTAAAAAALNAFAEGMAQGSQPSSGASQAPPSSYATSATPLLLYADNHERTFLGCLNCNKYDSSSVSNEYGEYGNRYSDTSIRNRYSEFGSRYSTLSACNPHASNPPLILDNDGDYYGRFTMNRYADDAANSDYFRRLVALLCRD